ncbi:MAG: flagellar hook-basal body complex protein [Planctomycetota bacterium]
MIRSLFTSASALHAHQEMLDVVGNNLANSNTTGFKSQRLRFSNQFTQLLVAQSAPSATSGGKNPVQIGLGVQVAAADTNLAQGTFENTGKKLDLAIQNGGFFVLKSGNETFFTRAGAFAVDSNNTLVDPATGAKVQRTGTMGEGTATAPAFQTAGVGDITIPKGITVPGNATENVKFKGNLDAKALEAVAEVLTMGQPLTEGGLPATTSTRLNNLNQTSVGYAAGDQIQITGTRVDGTSVNALYTATGTAADTVGALLGVINNLYLSATPGTGATASLDSAGHIVLTANQAGPATLTIGLKSNPTDPTPLSGVTQFTNFQASVDGKAADTATSVIQIFDNQFSPHNVTFTFHKVSPNRWDMSAALEGSEGVIFGFGNDSTVAGLTFNENGSFLGVVGTSVTQLLAAHLPFTVGGVPATTATPLHLLDQHTGGPYAAGDMIQISGIDHDGLPVGPVNFLAAGQTVGDLIDTINASFGGANAVLDASGIIQFAASVSGQSQLQLDLQDLPANTGGTTVYSDFNEITRGTDGDDDITFQISNLAAFGNKQTIKLDFGSSNGFDGLSQFGGFTTAASTQQDGFAQGTLVDVSVENDGTITGQFSNGRAEAIAQIALATFANSEGLDRTSNNYFKHNSNSGIPIISTALSGSAGSIQSGALESSNVDIGAEFTQLIAAQRGYQVNARAFSAANQMLEETANLLR